LNGEDEFEIDMEEEKKEDGKKKVRREDKIKAEEE
jgi:hypothetical protein